MGKRDLLPYLADVASGKFVAVGDFGAFKLCVKRCCAATLRLDFNGYDTIVAFDEKVDFRDVGPGHEVGGMMSIPDQLAHDGIFVDSALGETRH